MSLHQKSNDRRPRVGGGLALLKMLDSRLRGNDKWRGGFTLIELAVVLVVIGLIVGGIMAGTAMLRGAELRDSVTEMEKIKQAATNFRDKYMALPGDFAGATLLWGQAHGMLAACRVWPSTGKETCDGDGKGDIHTYDPTAVPNFTYYEQFRAFQHLANAGMLEGQYTGATGPGGDNDFVFGTNAPASSLSGGGYALYSAFQADFYSASLYFPGPWGHVILLGGQDTNNHPANAVMTTAEALDVDTKLDDGRPGYGNVQSFRNRKGIGPSANCANEANPDIAVYDSSFLGLQCALIFKTGF